MINPQALENLEAAHKKLAIAAEDFAQAMDQQNDYTEWVVDAQRLLGKYGNVTLAEAGLGNSYFADFIGSTGLLADLYEYMVKGHIAVLAALKLAGEAYRVATKEKDAVFEEIKNAIAQDLAVAQKVECPKIPTQAYLGGL